MFEFKKKQSYKKFIYSPITVIVLVIILAIFMKALWGVYEKEKISAQYLERERSELQKIEERQKDLNKTVEYLKTDKGIEAEIRSKFRLAKEGESIAIIVDNDSLDVSKSSTTPDIGFWGYLVDWFKGI